MYGNGGYVMLDFEGSTLSSSPSKIDGITFDILSRTSKPIIINNFKIGAKQHYTTYVLSHLDGDNLYLVFFVNASVGVERIVINKDNSIYYSTIPLSTNTLNIESEVSTNASKSDSNISK